MSPSPTQERNTGKSVSDTRGQELRGILDGSTGGSLRKTHPEINTSLHALAPGRKDDLYLPPLIVYMF